MFRISESKAFAEYMSLILQLCNFLLQNLYLLCQLSDVIFLSMLLERLLHFAHFLKGLFLKLLLLISQLTVELLGLSQDPLLSLRIYALSQIGWVAVETGLLFANSLSLYLLDHVLPNLQIALILDGH